MGKTIWWVPNSRPILPLSTMPFYARLPADKLGDVARFAKSASNQNTPCVSSLVTTTLTPLIITQTICCGFIIF